MNFTRDVLKLAALFPQHRVIGRSFGRDRVGMVDPTNWTLQESQEGAAASLYLEIFNTATGPNREGFGAHDLAACIQNGWADLTRYRFIAIPEDWAAALLHDKTGHEKVVRYARAMATKIRREFPAAFVTPEVK